MELSYKVELNTQDSENNDEDDLHCKIRKLRVLTAEDTVFLSEQHPHLARSSLPADPPDLHTAIDPYATSHSASCITKSARTSPAQSTLK
jgi:hypothetical protein